MSLPFDKRVVSSLPLEQLWNAEGFVRANQLRDIGEADIRDLLKASGVRFVVANIGEPLRWVSPKNCYDFWKSEVKTHLASDLDLMVDDFPDGYCYLASEWRDHRDEPIVLLTVFH